MATGARILSSLSRRFHGVTIPLGKRIRAKDKNLRAGIIGLDTSHAVAFAKLLNNPLVRRELAGCRIIAAYPQGSPDIPSSVSRVPEYTSQVQSLGIRIVDSIEALLEHVDVVFLETNDGRMHLEQVIPVLESGKPVFIDKPVAGSFADAVAIYTAAWHHQVPVFSSSSLRYSEVAQVLRGGTIGEVVGCDAYSPCDLEETHPDLFWYGIHGVEILFTVMGSGCRRVTRVSNEGTDMVVGTWADGRVGTFRGIRGGHQGYGCTVFGSKGIVPIRCRAGIRPLLVDILRFFRTGMPPLAYEATLEIYNFMDAADRSKQRGGVQVELANLPDFNKQRLPISRKVGE
ncbi:Predicted dehydrogenase [Singulisphaera sp. GP187]|uniref:Gfo/Idh/MocA family protein n=1 Tax=Singulisphaera sp. GP187 TaxID=1882752 RepID=UPI0009296329|nr:Gfo/Idh/MocA family oxidoreductase [Singulisphaera sp. GP187]SIO09891.1 Predicted dehydrogenase [Singulisphaera sp. GP187]